MLLEQEELIRKVMERIEVNPDEKMVRCYIRRLPKVPAVEEIAGKLEHLLGEARSANGNILHPVWKIGVTELVMQ